jgi:hypothetical protein
MVAPDLVSEDDIAKPIIPDDLSDESALKTYIEVKVYDKEGHLIQHHRQPMRSLTQYFLALMAIPIIGTYVGPSTNQAPNILVNMLGLPSQQSTCAYYSADIVWDWSLVLGSGTQQFSPTLTSLAAPISNGTGAGELYYGPLGVSYTATSISASTTVINYSASTITITEIGLKATIYLQYETPSPSFTYNTYNFLLSYDTFSTSISLPPNGIATFQITITFTG